MIVWSGTLGNTITEPLFNAENLAGELYLNQINADDNMILQKDLIQLQGDGASTYYFLPFKQWLND